MTTANLAIEYRVTSMNEAGADRVTVNMTQHVVNTADAPGVPAPYGGGSVSLNLSTAEASGYFPGQRYTVTFTPVTE